MVRESQMKLCCLHTIIIIIMNGITSFHSKGFEFKSYPRLILCFKSPQLKNRLTNNNKNYGKRIKKQLKIILRINFILVFTSFVFCLFVCVCVCVCVCVSLFYSLVCFFNSVCLEIETSCHLEILMSQHFHWVYFILALT